MTLTPSDIEQKTFSTALRGYNLDEVDDFLDEVVRSMRKLQEELEQARTELETKPVAPVEAAEPVVVTAPAQVVEPPPVAPIDESALGKALIAAQETAERIVTDARSEADGILVRARSEAETYEESRRQRKAEAEHEITRIDGLVDRVKSELAELSAAVGSELAEMTEVIETGIVDLDIPPADHTDSGDEGSPETVSVAADDENVVASAEEELAEDSEYDFGGESDGDDSEDDSEDDSDDSEDDSEDEYFIFPDGDEDDDEGNRPGE
jgi:DivIVA domain-containing protein